MFVAAEVWSFVQPTVPVRHSQQSSFSTPETSREDLLGRMACAVCLSRLNTAFDMVFGVTILQLLDRPLPCQVSSILVDLVQYVDG